MIISLILLGKVANYFRFRSLWMKSMTGRFFSFGTSTRKGNFGFKSLVLHFEIDIVSHSIRFRKGGGIKHRKRSRFSHGHNYWLFSLSAIHKKSSDSHTCKNLHQMRRPTFYCHNKGVIDKKIVSLGSKFHRPHLSG